MAKFEKKPPALPKRQLTAEEAAQVYGGSPDFYLSQPLEELPRCDTRPRGGRGRKVVVFRVEDLEAFWERRYVHA